MNTILASKAFLKMFVSLLVHRLAGFLRMLGSVWIGLMYTLFWFCCVLYYTPPRGCAFDDGLCAFVHTWPTWVHPLGLSSPLIVLIISIIVASWRDARNISVTEDE